MSANEGWVFPDSPNVPVYTSRQITEEGRPVLCVIHHADDATWEFHTDDPPVEEDGRICSLESMVARDSTLRDLADLPEGWTAIRVSPSDPWVRNPEPKR